MRRGGEETRRVEIECRICGTQYEGEVIMSSVAVPGVMGPVGERMKRAVDNCPKCGSYTVQPKRA